MRDTRFFAPADLLVQVLPLVHAEPCFALKGGTAINFFVRDFPRLSVDIDLTYLPVQDRPATLRGIDAALNRIAAAVHRALPGVKVHVHRPANDSGVVKLLLHLAGGAMVKIEPSTILRGTLFPTADRKLVPRAAEAGRRTSAGTAMEASEPGEDVPGQPRSSRPAPAGATGIMSQCTRHSCPAT